jgi:hypothetical protein
MIEATWKLDPIHATKNQSTDLTNDGPITKRWMSEVNISVNNLQIKPSSIMLPYGQSSASPNLQFQFDVNNANDMDQQKTVPIVIRKGNTVVWSGNKDIPANVLTTVTVNVNTSVSAGDIPFTVEVNPAPRQIVEYLRDGSDPYRDNVAQSALPVHAGLPPSYCNTVHTSNSWTVVHYLNEWRGHEDYWIHYPDPELGENFEPHKHYYCVTDWSSSWTETHSYYERYEITNVLFRSKLTDDTQGGWIDILHQPGKVKAGYGFEIKVLTKYQTNTYSASPKPWTSGCSGLSVNPTLGNPVDAPNVMQITMPFKDSSGQPVHYNLTTTSESGSWDNLTQTFEMPLHNAFGLKQTREIFTNTTARDGDYQIRLDTYPYFYGSFDKPPTRSMLCDTKFVTIRIVGADSDDIKSHITQ